MVLMVLMVWISFCLVASKSLPMMRMMRIVSFVIVLG